MTRSTLLFDPTPLLPALDRGTQLLTPNRRLASRIRSALLGDRAAAPMVPVRAISDWLQLLWDRLLFSGDELADVWVLSPSQELALWERAVRASALPLLRPAQAAEQAASAYRTLGLWRQLPLSAAARADCLTQPDSAALVEWLDRFEQLCSERGAIAIVERDRRVATAVREGRLPLPEALLGIGFDDLPPLYAELLGRAAEFTRYETTALGLSADGLREDEGSGEGTAHVQVLGADTLEQQLQAAALWVRAQLQANPNGPFAIVVPELNQQRALVERVLLDVLAPEHALPDRPRALPPLNFSAGEALAQTPLLQCALQLLELAAPSIERAALLQLLDAPFHLASNVAGSPEQHAALTELVERVCDLRVTSLRAAQLRRCADSVAQRHPQWLFAERLQQLAERIRRERWQSARTAAAVWAERFVGVLDLFGWPGPRTLDSIEYQQHRQWQQALIEFARIDQVLEAMDFGGALQRLRQILQAQVFQPKTADTPVQVLGVLEAAGLQFAGLWLCDMGDDRWPAPASPHPLLPRELQRHLRMPRCDAEREHEIAARLTRSLLGSARAVVVSYQRQREEVARRVSPLFAQFAPVSIEQLLGAPLGELLPARARHAQARAEFEVETSAAGDAPPLRANERVRGGSALFQDQAACPFRAFARHRLGARPLAEPVAGLDAAERGNILHAALEAIWRQLPSHAALLALSESERVALAQQSAQAAVQQFLERAAHRIGPRFAAIESVRLAQLLLQWLEVEAAREPFTVVATEQRVEQRFADLPLRLRVDRIDRLADGRLLIIDYKTKMANSSVEDWLGERPDEPQLPLYGTLLQLAGDPAQPDGAALQQVGGNEVAGIAFAQVRPERPQYVGLADDAAALRGFKTPAQVAEEGGAGEWPALQQQWRTVLENLAAAFIRGEAHIDPKKAQVCSYCELASVCRIAHQSRPDAETE